MKRMKESKRECTSVMAAEPRYSSFLFPCIVSFFFFLFSLPDYLPPCCPTRPAHHGVASQADGAPTQHVLGGLCL